MVTLEDLQAAPVGTVWEYGVDKFTGWIKNGEDLYTLFTEDAIYTQHELREINTATLNLMEIPVYPEVVHIAAVALLLGLGKYHACGVCGQ